MKLAVITYIFGKNTELLREPLAIDNNIEYICVTDQKNLTSNVWQIIYEPFEHVTSCRDKTALAKFNPFKYTNADRIIIQDSALKCISPLQQLFDQLDTCDICLKKHPWRENLAQELPAWRQIRGLPDSQINKFNAMAKHDNIKLTDIPLFECCILCVKNNTETKDLFSTLLSLMKLLGDNGNMIMTQQCPFAYLLKVMYPSFKIGTINQNKFFTRYAHGSNTIIKE